MAFSVKCGADQIAQGMISRLQSAAITLAPLTAQATSRIPDERRKFCFDANGHVVGVKADWHHEATNLFHATIRDSYCRLKPKAPLHLPTSATFQAIQAVLDTVEVRAELGLRLAGSMAIFVSKHDPNDILYIKTIRSTAFLALLNALMEKANEFARGWLRSIIDPLVMEVIQTKFPPDAFSKLSDAPYHVHVPTGCPSLPSPEDIFYKVEPCATSPLPIPAPQLFSHLVTTATAAGNPPPQNPHANLARQQEGPTGQDHPVSNKRARE
ncbi:hypothetical protein ONZ45_g18947 [Pleurotus djamor]|nr:hypothetical protein ONZ45_g18947 [Pleurotus djamor]